MSGDVITTNTAAYSLHYFPYLSMTALQLIRLRMLHARSLYGTLKLLLLLLQPWQYWEMERPSVG